MRVMLVPPRALHEEARRAALADQRRPAIPKVALQPGHGFVADGHEPLLAPLPARRQEPAVEVHVGDLEPDQAPTRGARRVEHFDERAVAKAAGDVRIGLCEQPIHFLDSTGTSGARARREAAAGRRQDSIAGAADDQVPVEAARGGDRASDGSRREAAHHLAHELFEAGAIDGGERNAGAGGEPAEVCEIARVALDGVHRQPALDAEVIEVGVDQRRDAGSSRAA
jgi:hypothetical protein